MNGPLVFLILDYGGLLWVRAGLTLWRAEWGDVGLLMSDVGPTRTIFVWRGDEPLAWIEVDE